jgi:tryptophan halogenase
VNAPRDVVIVGRDAPVWLAACVLQRALAPAGVQLTVVELPGLSRPADLYATLPALEALHTRLGIDEGRMLGATRGAFALGKNFVDTANHGPAFFHAYGSTGARIDDTEFLPHWIRARRAGLTLGYEEFCLTAAAAKHGRMLLPDAEIEAAGFTDYAYHLPAIPYGEWLKSLAQRRGVAAHEARAAQVELHADGSIAALGLDGGRRVAGDFFIDLTGSEAQLLGATLGVALESWRNAFVVDRTLTAFGPPLTPLPIYSEIRAWTAGWTGLYASQACTHVVQAYSSELASDTAAFEAAMSVARLDLRNAVVRASDPGRRTLAWHRNCVALGDAACTFDPLHSVDLQAVQVGLVHLLPLFPVAGDYDVERNEYNENVRAAYLRLRDFQSAHYRLNRYGASPFWRRAREKPVSHELTHRLAAFRARGEAVHYEDESFSIDDWRGLLLGHGVQPETWDPAADRTPAESVKQELRRQLDFIRHKVEGLDSHATYLRSVGAVAAHP